MKYLTVICLIFPSLLFAQRMQVKEVSAKMSNGLNNGLRVDLPEVDDKDVEKAWKKLMKDFDSKPSSKKNEIFADDAHIPTLSANTVDVYAVIDKEKDKTVLTVFFDLGGAYLNSSAHRDMYVTASNLVRTFAVDITREAMQKIVDDETKKLEGLSDDLEDLQKEKEKLQKTIEDCKETIQKSEDDLQKNGKNQESKKKSIGEQEKNLERARARLKAIE